MGMIFAFISAFLFAVNNILIRKGMKVSKTENENGVLTTIFINVVVFILAYLVYLLFNKEPVRFNWNGVIYFILAGFLTIFVGRVTFFEGIKRIGASKAAALKNSSPMFTLIFAIFILDEFLSVGQFIGVGLIVIGILIQSYNMFRKTSERNKFGFAIALAAAISFGIGQGIRKQGLQYLNDPFAGALIGAIVALLCFLIVSMFKRNFIETVKLTLSEKNIYFYLGGIATGLATLFFFIGIWFTKVAFVATIVAADPVITVILSKFFLKEDENINHYIVISAVFVFLGATVIAIMA